MYLLQLLLKEIQVVDILQEVLDIYMVVAELAVLVVKIIVDQVEMVE
jgi:hypothetical protein